MPRSCYKATPGLLALPQAIFDEAFSPWMQGLLGEGAVQVLYSKDDFITDPILAAVGELQFEVVQYRMKNEYNVRAPAQHFML